MQAKDASTGKISTLLKCHNYLFVLAIGKAAKLGDVRNEPMTIRIEGDL